MGHSFIARISVTLAVHGRDLLILLVLGNVTMIIINYYGETVMVSDNESGKVDTFTIIRRQIIVLHAIKIIHDEDWGIFGLNDMITEENDIRREKSFISENSIMGDG